MDFVTTATDPDIKDRRFQRKISIVRKSAQLIMVIEATDPNWMDDNNGAGYTKLTNCILANNCMIAGHVIIGDNVAMMGGVGVHHFARIGKFCFIGGYARIHHDEALVESVEEFDGKVIYLPPYSSDFNLIKTAFSLLKT